MARIGTLILIALVSPAAALVGFGQDVDDPPIRYSKTPASDPVALLKTRLQKGAVRLTYHPARGYLDSFLNALGISPSSQLLVFSKTSFQRDFISPLTPRALYFNDDVYVGWVQGGPVLEVSAADPQLGGVFYVVEQDPEGPKIHRQQHECLSCHESGLTGNLPGHTVRSVLTLRDGLPTFNAGTYVTGPASPFEERWGGWYVTGNAPGLTHLGNLTFGSAAEANAPERARGTAVPSLSPYCSTRPYLTAHSDLVAHLVLAHQVEVHNRITRASYETRRALAFEAALQRELGRDTRLDSTTRRIGSVCEPLVRSLLCAGEAPLPGPVAGSSGYASWFARQGARDRKGRSLRELDLRTRLFRYPCSFLIQSGTFTALPPEAKSYVYRRLEEVLSGKDASREFSHLTPPDRRAIREILADTLPDFPAAPR